MKGKLLSALITVSLSNITLAAALQPNHCPGAVEIINVGLDRAVVDQDRRGTWAVGYRSAAYGTKQNWTFAIGRIQASNADEAYARAAGALPTIQFTGGPKYIPQMKRWMCQYSTAAGFEAAAVTPVIGNIAAITG